MAQELLETRDGLPFDAPGPIDEPAHDGLETALSGLDERLATATTALATAQKHLKQAVEAARLGNLRDLPRALEQAAESSATLSQTALDARRAWTFDGQRHLESGRYVAELLARAEASGLSGVREVDGQVNSFPVVVKVSARDLSLKVGRRAHRGVRPSVVVGLLQKMRSQPVKGNLNKLLVQFEKAYLHITRNQDGVAVPLKQIYDVFVLGPGEIREYSELDFLLDVYKLDRAAPQVTAAGRELSFPASTGAKAGRGIPFTTETGEERIYSSVRFDSVR
jgi:hypothetical protein